MTFRPPQVKSHVPPSPNNSAAAPRVDSSPATAQNSRAMAAQRERLDELVVRRGLAPSRSQARALIMAGRVRHGTEVLDKAGHRVAADLEIDVVRPPQYVSRGAEKLAGWFAAYPWPVAGKRFLDVGASTGGFTDYLLQEGAGPAVCVDVGRAQLHPKLVGDERVTSLEGTNARHLRPEDLPYAAYPLIVMDLSFISLRLILPVAWPLLEEGGLLVALVKPQFEAGKAVADRCRGVIRDEGLRESIRDEVLAFAESTLPGLRLHGCRLSPVVGSKGNREYLAGWTRQSPGTGV